MIVKYKVLLNIIVFAFITLQLTACGSVQVGHDFNVRLFKSSVKANVTTQSQVKSWLGEANSKGVSLDKDGELSDEWMYFYGAGSLSDMKSARLKILQIRFNKNGIVNSYNWSSSQ